MTSTGRGLRAASTSKHPYAYQSPLEHLGPLDLRLLGDAADSNPTTSIPLPVASGQSSGGSARWQKNRTR